jgi:hypothetical protein
MAPSLGASNTPTKHAVAFSGRIVFGLEAARQHARCVPRLLRWTRTAAYFAIEVDVSAIKPELASGYMVFCARCRGNSHARRIQLIVTAVQKVLKTCPLEKPANPPIRNHSFGDTVNTIARSETVLHRLRFVVGRSGLSLLIGVFLRQLQVTAPSGLHGVNLES